jgi:hypothetical protein
MLTMGDVSLSDLPAAAFFARLGTMAHQLGMDPFQFESSRKQLTSSLKDYARVAVDGRDRRIAVRTTVPRPPMLTRPGTTFLDVETNLAGAIPFGTLLVVGPATVDEDLSLLANGMPAADLPETRNVDAKVIAQLRERLLVLGQNVGVLGQRRVERNLQWLLGVELGADSVRAVCTVADLVSVAPYQQMLLGAMHEELARNGCLVTLACAPWQLERELTVEYRDLAWEQAVTTASRVGADAGKAFGVLAGAFVAERAAALEITFRSDGPARVRAAIEQRPG